MKAMSAQEAMSFSQMQEGLVLPRKLAVWAILSTYFFCVFVWDSPPGPLKTALVPIIAPLIEATSIGQGWSVFSPDVREANYHETALIKFKDGLLKLYEFPRMQKLDLLTKFRCEKYRKMFFDCMPWPDHLQFLPDFSKFVADLNSWPDNPPKSVSFLHHSCRMPQPDPSHWVNRSDFPEHTLQRTYYVYHVR
jgi:hypothetical protein